jgi:hypothetical protein
LIQLISPGGCTQGISKCDGVALTRARVDLRTDSHVAWILASPPPAATVRQRAEAVNVGSKFRKRSPLFNSVLIKKRG